MTVIEAAQRVIAVAKENPGDIEARISAKSLVRVCEILIQEGFTHELTDDHLHVKMLRIRAHYPRYFVLAQYPARTNFENLTRIEFKDGEIITPPTRR
jgi:hypothetical protein